MMKHGKHENSYEDHNDAADEEHDQEPQSVFHSVISFLYFPIRLLVSPFVEIRDWLQRPVELGHPHSYVDYDPIDTAEDGPDAPIRSRMARLGRALLRVPMFILRSPFLIVRAVFFGGKWELLYLLPAMLTIGFVGFVFFQVFANGDRILNRYRIGANNAIHDGNVELAKTYFNRVVKESKLTDKDRLQWAIILYQTGETERSQRIFDELAPDERSRFAPAHRMKAIAMAAQLGKSSDPLMLRKLRHHLESSNDDSLEIKRAWAAYYVAVDHADKALVYLREASELDPRCLLMIANIYERKGLTQKQNEALEQAEAAYREILANDPLDSANRITLAQILVQRKKFSHAETLMSTGLRLQPDPVTRRATAELYVLGYDMAVREGKDFSERFAFLQRALALDENHVPVYMRLMALYQQPSTAANAAQIKQALLESLAGDKPSALAHFALSNILWIEGNLSESQWHVEQAYKLQPNFSFVINNLAWMLAHQEDPDLDRALELAEMAVKQSPNDALYNGTYGTVLFFQKKYEDAITPLQKALPDNPEAKSIHEKLAKCFQELGKPELAKVHRKKAGEE